MCAAFAGALEFGDSGLAAQLSQACFVRGLVIETAGIDDQVLKLLPSLTISGQDLRCGLEIIDASLAEVLGARSAAMHEPACELAKAA